MHDDKLKYYNACQICIGYYSLELYNSIKAPAMFALTIMSLMISTLSMHAMRTEHIFSIYDDCMLMYTLGTCRIYGQL